MRQNRRAQAAAPWTDSSTPGPSPLDEEIVQELQILADENDDILRELVDAYVDDAKTRLRDLRDDIGRGDAQALGEISHSLRGSSGNLGAQVVATLCGSLEAMARNDNTGNDAQRMLLLLEGEFQRAEHALRMLTA